MAAVAAIDNLLAWAAFGLHLSQPWRVVIVGRPNVGKSSLINALVGYGRSIVFDQPGTTRDVVTAEAAFDGWTVQLADTAGLRDAESAVEAAGIARARAVVSQADCRLVVLDSSRPCDAEDRALLAEWPDAIVVANKTDLPDAWGSALPRQALRVSSLDGTGIDDLGAALAARLVPNVPAPGTAVPVTERQVRLLQEMRDALGAGDEEAARVSLEDLLR